MTLDLAITGGTIIDGTGAAGYVGSVGIRGGVIVEVGELTSEATATIDATGQMVCPGFIDPHTHYDAQILWDPLATPSSLHGITTVVMGNCGFSIAPLGSDADATYIREMLVKVEGMPLVSLELGTDWAWRSFGDYLGRIEGNTAVNVATQVGHSAIRRTVMGADAVGKEATPEQVEAMAALIREAIEAGAIGFSTTQSFTHSDADGQPVPSRWATADELVALSEVLAAYPGTTLEWATDGTLRGFSQTELDLMADMSRGADRPINWNVLTIDSSRPDDYREQIAASAYAAERGGRVVALTMPVLVGMNMNFGSYCGLWQLPGWNDVLGLDHTEKMAALARPEVRADLQTNAAKPEAGAFGRLTGWERYRIGDTFSEANEGLKGRLVGDIAAERGVEPFDALIDIVLADECRTVLWPGPTDDDDESWQLRKEAWQLPDVMIGGSDAGAHLDRMAGSSYTTEWLDDCLRGQKLTTVEDAVRHLTEVPAGFFGFHDRGHIAVDKKADLVIFDPKTVGGDEATLVHDLPGDASRLFSNANGISHVIVNGTTVVGPDGATGELPGHLLRSGIDTRGTSVSGNEPTPT